MNDLLEYVFTKYSCCLYINEKYFYLESIKSDGFKII